jgi:hypothetical protein
VTSPLSDALGGSGPTRKTLQRNELLHYAAHGPGEVTTEQALRALILELARRWPEWLSTQGPIDAEAEAAFEQRMYRDRRSPAEQKTGGSLELPERDTWADDPRTKSLSARIVELERGKVEEEEE